MLPLYDTGIKIYSLFVSIASLFNKKAKYWIEGRKEQYFTPVSKSIWFHFASLGEFEQGRPVLEKVRSTYPEHQIVITFFSPSGFEIRKSTTLADYVYYLPVDTAKNAYEFIEAINPQMVVFTKYEYWYHFFKALKKKGIPLYIISGIFRDKQLFFRWYGSLHREMLNCVTHFFVQDQHSKHLLQKVHHDNVTVTGDTRFDRVWENSLLAKKIEPIEQFKSKHPVFIAGSTWPKDEEILIELIGLYPDWKFIFAPHEISKERINKLYQSVQSFSAVRFSEIQQLTIQQLADAKVLIVDNIGMLSSIYQYGEIAYIGGGFGAGVHNTLEAAAFGLPVIFGPNYEKFKEIKDLIRIRSGFCVTNAEDLKNISLRLINHKNYIPDGEAARKYVEEQRGATDKIMENIHLIA